DGLLLRPGEVFSYWRLIGKPSRRKGYREGMILVNGTVRPGVGGGLCQLSNLIFWMTLHTPLTVIERHRHGYDVFPDSNRTQPFGSGATCFYPYGDLMIRNDTEDTYQILVHVGETDLEGEWRVSSAPKNRFEIAERNHQMCGEVWGGFTRHNELYRQEYDLEGRLLSEELVISNSAIMMYSPFLEEKKE
ncbi:MAG: VanW family protein, partial [Oscillospiraceae bacterium]|nr:VanW family protein [Oscillospiraceae bacterium]